MKKSKLYSEVSKIDGPHILYLVILYNDTECFLKIGITSQTVEERMGWIENYNYTLLKTIKGNGLKVRGYESVLKERILDYNKHYQPKEKIAGYTECYEIGYQKDIEAAFKYIDRKREPIVEVRFDREKVEILKKKIDMYKNIISTKIKQIDKLSIENKLLGDEIDELIDQIIIFEQQNDKEPSDEEKSLNQYINDYHKELLDYAANKNSNHRK